MDLERFADDVADGHSWIQRRIRILEDHLHAAAHLAHVLAAELGELDAVELHLAGRRLVELEDRAAGRGLAASGLADETERLALLDEEIDPIDRADGADLALEDDPLREREVHLERLDVEEILAAVEGRRAADTDHVRIAGFRRGVHGHLSTSYIAAGGGRTSPGLGSGRSRAPSGLIPSMARAVPPPFCPSVATSPPPR